MLGKKWLPFTVVCLIGNGKRQLFADIEKYSIVEMIDWKRLIGND